ncbi:MAG TPA: hypothetical protein ENK32_04590 [Anaerolineae bacterium]|nr:hypothetical protein [Anaerolineae bacterium]
MKVISYKIHLHEPVLVKGLEGDPNSGVSYHFLPGSVLRGALIGRYRRRRQADALMQDSAARRLFFNPDATRFLNGYLLCRHDGETVRALPTPLSWHFCKLEKRPSRIECDESDETQPEYFDHAIQPVKAEDVCPEGEGDSWQRASAPFCAPLSNNQAALAAVNRRIAIHTTRNRDYGRARADGGEAEEILNGAVYRYETIAAGQTFAACILCRDEDAAALAELIDGEILLGGARTAGYGRVSLTLDPQPAEGAYEAGPLDEWREYTPYDAPFDGVVVTLLSDVLLRDEYGQPQSTPAELARQLGFTPADLRATFAAYRQTGGFNRKWGLPILQQTALQMGSVFVFNAPSEAQMAVLRRWEKTGIGERREDGFGRLAVNWHTAASFAPVTLKSPKREAVPLSSAASKAMAQTIVDNLHRARLDEALREQAKRLAEGGRMETVSKTQINRLRLQLQTAVHAVKNHGGDAVAGQRQELENYSKSLSERNYTRRQFEKARLGGRPFLDWLQTCITAAEMPVAGRKEYIIGGVKPQANAPALRAECNWRLADLTLARIVKQRRAVELQKEGQNERD